MTSKGDSESERILRLLVKPVAEAFRERFGELIPPQIESIPQILEGRNLLLMSPTGTGKTEAAMLPILSSIMLEGRTPGVKLVYITPLRALNRDLLERIEWWSQKLDLTVSVRHGDTGAGERRMQALSPPDMLITTPETLQAILTGRVLRRHLKAVRWVIVDEIHELAMDKRGVQLSVGLERLVEIVGRRFQRVGLSATIGDPERIASFLVGADEDCEIVRVPLGREMKLDVVFPRPTAKDRKLAEKLLTFPSVAARLSKIRELVESHQSTLVFTNTRPLAEILTNRFRAWDSELPMGVHHGSLAKPSRLSAEQGLKRGTLMGIICTSSLELGIDVGAIDFVVQYNSPREVTRLTQRVGRSGHKIGRTARGTVIVSDSDDALEAMAITRRAKLEELEEPLIPENSSDVLAHQIAGLLVERSRWTIQEILDIVKRAYPFHSLKLHQLRDVVSFMSALRLANIVEDEYITRAFKSKPLFDYYFNTLSMIPEVRQYLVVNEATQEPIGILDEEFVSEHGDPGTKFVLTGKPWNILHTEGDKIYVSALEGFEGAVPSWVGEEIPVPFEIAQEVGAVRAELEWRCLAGEKYADVCSDIALRYEVEPDVALRALKEVWIHLKRHIPVPADKSVLIERHGKFTVMHICGGLKINRTIARLVAFDLSERIGAPIATQQDAYRIAFQSSDVYPGLVLESLHGLSESGVKERLVSAVESSGLFKRRVMHVARKMGVLKKEASLLDVTATRIVEAVKGTPVYDEALKVVIYNDLDVKGTEDFLRKAATGEIQIETMELTEGLSPLARLTVQRYRSEFEVAASDRIERLVLNAVKARLMNEAPLLVCASCWDFADKRLVKDLDEHPRCPRCSSPRLGVIQAEPSEVYGLVARKGRATGSASAKRRSKILATSRLVEKYGKAAVIVLVGRRISRKDIQQILQKHGKVSDDLVLDMIEAEKRALRRMFR